MLALSNLWDSYRHGVISEYQRREIRPDKSSASLFRKIVTVARWFAAPVATVAASWCLALRPKWFLDNIPSLFSSYAGSLKRVLPLHPTNLKDAFDLGAAYHSLLQGKLEEALAAAAKIAGRAVTRAELEALPKLIEDMVNEKSTIGKILGAFSIVNMVWFVSIVGLGVFVGPFLYYVLSPLREILYKFSVFLFNKIIALGKILLPLGEPLLYTLSFLVLVEAHRYAEVNGDDPYTMTGVMTAVTSIAALLLSWGSTTAFNSTGGGDKELFMTITSTLATLYCIPTAVTHQSKFIGYIAMTFCAMALKFSAYSTGLCTMIGFHSYRDLMKAAFGCGSLMVFNFVLKAVGVDSRWLQPFQSAVGVLGTSVYLLALDINMYVSRDSLATIWNLINIGGLIVAGELLQMHGMANVGKTYAGLFLFTLFCKAHPTRGDGMVVWWFAFFGILYGGSLFLSRNPQYLAAVMAGGM